MYPTHYFEMPQVSHATSLYDHSKRFDATALRFVAFFGISERGASSVFMPPTTAIVVHKFLPQKKRMFVQDAILLLLHFSYEGESSATQMTVAFLQMSFHVSTNAKRCCTRLIT